MFRVTETQGLREGFKALRTRFRQCRGGYRLQWLPDGSFVVRLADGALLPQSEASDSIIRTLRDGAALPMPDLEKIGFPEVEPAGSCVAASEMNAIRTLCRTAVGNLKGGLDAQNA